MNEQTMPNADSLDDLCPENRTALLNYINESFKMVQKINRDYTAYGLKARFNRLTGPNKKHHITSQYFMEAMVASGYKAVLVPNRKEPNWYFNVGKVRFTD